MVADRLIPVQSEAADSAPESRPKSRSKSHSTARDFHVDTWLHALGGFVSRHRSLFLRLGGLESRLMADAIATIEVRAPIFVTGLARSGSTILLEILDAHPATTAHRYSDYPLLYTPYWWNRFVQRAATGRGQAVERSHRDGILITPESPEAFEEVLWMTFFTHLHDPARSAVLGAGTSNAEFEAFYRDHIRKLLAVRGARRYVSKGNYNITRLEYLLELFPDARFVIPVRDPVWHIASLMKQHALFCEQTRASPRALEHLRRIGHYEFGLDRRPINAGDDACIREILAHFQEGRELQAWAQYWNHIYGYAMRLLESNARVREATLVVHFEDLCADPRNVLRGLLDHCRLDSSNDFVELAAARIHFPSYYTPPFTAAERELIERYTAGARAHAARCNNPSL